MPTNETGYTVTVGPDTEGHYFEVVPGEDYDLPALPPYVDPDTGKPGDPPAEVIEDAPTSEPAPKRGAKSTPPAQETADTNGTATSEGASS